MSASEIGEVSTLAQGTASLEHAVDFVTATFGPDVVATVAMTRPMRNVYLLGGKPVAFLRLGASPGYLDVLEHRDPAARRPAPRPTDRCGRLRRAAGTPSRA